MKTLSAFIILAFLGSSCGPANAPDQNRIPPTVLKSQNDSIVPEQKDKSNLTEASDSVTIFFPFSIRSNEGQNTIDAFLGGEELYPKYSNFFKKYGYEGNGYCWEGHIIQILEKLNRTLLTHIDFDSEGGAFYATVDTKENQMKFIKLLSPIFSDLKQLAIWVKKADRSRIDD